MSEDPDPFTVMAGIRMTGRPGRGSAGFQAFLAQKYLNEKDESSMTDERLVKEIRKDAVRSALVALEQVTEGEVWFHPGNNGDLGALYVGDEFIASIRTRTS